MFYLAVYWRNECSNLRVVKVFETSEIGVMFSEGWFTQKLNPIRLNETTTAYP